MVAINCSGVWPCSWSSVMGAGAGAGIMAGNGWRRSWGCENAGGSQRFGSQALALGRLGMARTPEGLGLGAGPVTAARRLDGVALVPAMRCRSDAAGRLSVRAPARAAGPGVGVAVLVEAVGAVVAVAAVAAVVVVVVVVLLVVAAAVAAVVVAVVVVVIAAMGTGAVADTVAVDGGAMSQLILLMLLILLLLVT